MGFTTAPQNQNNGRIPGVPWPSLHPSGEMDVHNSAGPFAHQNRIRPPYYCRRI